MKRHLTNAAYGVLDYASHPVAMLLVAPIVLHRLGAAEYGLWTIATAVISTGGIIAAGFCDANIQRVARLRGTGEMQALVETVRSMLAINFALGALVAVFVWSCAPYAARHIAVARVVPVTACVLSLRIAAVLVLVRAVENVSVSTQRAFEQYKATVQVSTAVRLLTLVCAAGLALAGHGAVSILLETGLFLVIGTCMQLWQLRRLIGKISLRPTLHLGETRLLLQFGAFSWLQALGSVVFGQFDRLLLGLSLGALAVTPYALCVQFAQPIFGVTASGLQFLFPYLSSRATEVSHAEMKRLLTKAFACNLLLVSCMACLLLLFGERLIKAWAGAKIAHDAAPLLAPIVLASSSMALSVTATYALLAFGLFRVTALMSLSGRVAGLLLMLYLLRHHGVSGLVTARFCYGVFALLLYVPLLRRMNRDKRAERTRVSVGLICELQEEPEL